MEDMAQEFGDMLKETLDRMRERIEVHALCMLFVRLLLVLPGYSRYG